MRQRVLCLATLSAAAALAAEWMRAPGILLMVGVALAALTATLAVARSRVSTGGAPRLLAWAAAALALLLGGIVVRATIDLARLHDRWPAVRAQLVRDASRNLGSELDDAVQLARRLADRAAALEDRSAKQAFPALDALLEGGGPAHGVALFDRRGHPRAWAGIQRSAPLPSGPDLSVVTTPFYLWLVARRQTSAGTAVATVLLARSDDVPRAGEALTDRFALRTGVGLRFIDARVAAADSDVYAYARTGAAGDTLFRVQPVPPTQSEAQARRLGGARRETALLVLGILIIAGALSLRGPLPLLLIPSAAALGVLARAPLRDTFATGLLFLPDTYLQRLLGPYSASAGALLIASIVVFVVACALWHRGLRPTWPTRLLAVGGTLVAPYLLQTLARGILPPASGVTADLWITWQVALMVSASAVVLLAAALVRGTAAPVRAGPWPFVASAIALVAAVLGLWLWEPRGAWPEWYPYLWAPALLLALRPMPFRGTLATIAVVAGSSAALLTWGATTEGRMALAARDVEGLGVQVEPRTLTLLDRLVHETPVDSAPRTAGDLFILWRRSALGVQSHPASLAVWASDGTRELGLDLAELDVPTDFVRQVAAEAAGARLPLVRPILRVPGLHGVAALPLADGRVLTVTIGPQSVLVAPSRVARFLLGAAADAEPPYEAMLAPPGREGVYGSRVTWRREGWQLRGERTVSLPGGQRHVHAMINLRGPSPILQRGGLLMVLDVAVLVVLWVLVELATGRAMPALTRWWPRAHRSLRARLSLSLALFFVAPTIAFAVWSFGRVEDEFRGARELLLQRTLRDAAGALPADASLRATLLPGAARRVDTELLLSEDGELTATSAPVLADLGLMDLLVPGDVYRRLAFGDEIELAEDQRAAPSPTLVGYRLLGRGEAEVATILGAPEFLSDRAVRQREADLGIAVTVAGVLGFFAALVLAGLAARALAEPLQQLRRAALAVGAGERPSLVLEDVPLELEAIGGALTQAAEQVEAGQRAQRVLAWGEMARQVAHEIKNPLTPIRLGVQHLLRLFKERPAELETALPQTGERILAEIDRLDSIARAFSRFALPGAQGVPLETVDLGGVVRDVVQLYRVGGGAVQWEAEAPDGLRAQARRDELVEVLVNLCENARDGGATRVVITARADGARAVIEARDDGRGIAPDVLPHIFEPRFSTNTSGSGLGLAIARRLVESWGGSIAVVPAPGPGTTVRLELRVTA